MYTRWRIDPEIESGNNIDRFINLSTCFCIIAMNFQKIKESDDVELPLLLRNRLTSLVGYVQEKIEAGQFDGLTLAEIAKDNRMTIPQLMEFGFTKANLVCHAVVAYNEQMMATLIPQDLASLGSSVEEQIQAYLLQMYHYDAKRLVFKTAAQSYVWSWSVVDEGRYTNQIMKLMSPIYMALHAHGFSQIDARCQAIWALYMRGLRAAAVSKGTPDDCLNTVRQALQLITESKK